jgi:hypothetical protein
MKILFTLLVLFVAAPAFAQTTPAIGQPFTVQFDHDGVFADFYTLSINGTVLGGQRPKSAVLVGTVGSIPVPAGLPTGTHTLVVAVINANNNVPSAPLTVTPRQPAPVPPTNLRIVTTSTIAINADGSVSVVASQTSVAAIPTAP